MACTILQIVQQFCARTALPVPSQVFGAVDAATIQYGALANEVLEDMVDRGYWQELIYEATFTSVASEDQGDIYTIAPNGLDYILNKTIFDRTLRLPIYGPLSPSEWQALKALPTTGPLYQYRIRNNRLLTTPAMAAGHSCAFEYKSTWYVQKTGGATFDSWFTADSDMPYIDERVFIQGCRWKWKYEKGLDYAEDKELYDSSVLNTLSTNATKKTINLASPVNEIQPGIFVPAGNWPLP